MERRGTIITLPIITCHTCESYTMYTILYYSDIKTNVDNNEVAGY